MRSSPFSISTCFELSKEISSFFPTLLFLYIKKQPSIIKTTTQLKKNMMQSQVHHKYSNAATQVTQSLFPFPGTFDLQSKATKVSVKSGSSWLRRNQKTGLRYGRGGRSKITAVAGSVETKTSVKAIVSVKVTGNFLSNFGVNKGLDDLTDLLGKTLLLELLSTDLDPKTGKEKPSIKAYAHQLSRHGDIVRYEAGFVVPESFGDVGAVLVENEHHKEMFLEDIVLEGFTGGSVGLSMTCGSFVHSKYDSPQKRIFFTNKSYLPSKTPSGLKKFRAYELELLRGDGTGVRKDHDRIYDYDTYNDLGNPDSNPKLKRPILGGPKHPYPRRCRTGRAPTKSDPKSESRAGNVYVPRDECFADTKQASFSVKTVSSVLHAVVPSIQTAIVDGDLGFPFFTAIDQLYNEGVNLPPPENGQTGILKTAIPRLFKMMDDVHDSILQFETPAMVEKDKFAWFRDEEFSRQTLAGINPHVIELVKEWPLKSKLDPEIYGPPESAITKEIIERAIRGFMTLEKAIAQKKLFMLDYHDVFLPYVNKVREIKGTTLYGSRTLFFLAPDSTLMVLAIELTRPPSEDLPQWKKVYTPGWDATTCWLWRLAKAHVLAHDSGFHQLVSHWLRTHACTEPYIIATNRQLSQMHPIYRLLHPHFRYTMEINGLAREALINGGGIIESAFSPGKYSIELSSVAYDALWRFDLQALPADLIHRGLAVEDPTAPHGLKLEIEDFPYANDGLLLWDIIKEWVTDYVNHYYEDPTLIKSDEELQAWWTEIRTVGHGDKKDEPWWPKLETPQDLIGIITTIVWVTSGHHAAVNFGQYDYSGYFPNRPTITRINMPDEEPINKKRFDLFMDKPETVLLQTFPSQIQATTVMAILDVLSTHSPDEEYLGEKAEPGWTENPVIHAAFERLNGRLVELEGVIDAKNVDPNLKNRSGAGVVPYELLKPFSDPGVTAKGVPYSISI